MYNLFHLVAYIFLAASCLLQAGTSSAAPDSATYDWLFKEKLRKFKILESNLSKPLINRIRTESDWMLESVIEFDRSIGIEDPDYKVQVPSDEDLAMFSEYIKVLPQSYRKVFSEKLLAVYFFDNFTGAALTDWLIDGDGKFYYYIIINSALLRESMDDWLSYRENSYFQSGSGFSIKIHTGTRYKALMYGFLHEGGHIIDIEYHVTPFIDTPHKQFIRQVAEVSEFTRDVWLKQTTPAAQYDFKLREKLNPYAMYSKNELIQGNEMPGIFSRLTKSPFVSIYSTVGWHEDFADMMTYSHIEKNLGGSIRMRLYKREEIINEYFPAKQNSNNTRARIINEFID